MYGVAEVNTYSVTEGTYCEDVQELKNVYVNEITWKITTKVLCVETLNYNFNLGRNIVEDDDANTWYTSKLGDCD
jgi:hypothetical protein